MFIIIKNDVDEYKIFLYWCVSIHINDRRKSINTTAKQNSTSFKALIQLIFGIWVILIKGVDLLEPYQLETHSVERSEVELWLGKFALPALRFFDPRKKKY